MFWVQFSVYTHSRSFCICDCYMATLCDAYFIYIWLYMFFETTNLERRFTHIRLCGVLAWRSYVVHLPWSFEEQKSWAAFWWCFPSCLWERNSFFDRGICQNVNWKIRAIYVFIFWGCLEFKSVTFGCLGTILYHIFLIVGKICRLDLTRQRLPPEPKKKGVQHFNHWSQTIYETLQYFLFGVPSIE